MNTRTLHQVIPGMPTSDGAGVKLRRSLGASQTLRLDPFLMLDEFSSENPDDYVAGFPAHPHRGFETVTYMLDGHMRHEDHMGNVGELKSGGVQWMTAGRGIIHSEMPQQESGRMRGFQLWINLPAEEKMKPAAYRDIQASDIPTASLANGGQVKVIAGSADIDGKKVEGPINGLTTEPLYLDVHLPAGASFTQSVTNGHNAFVYSYEGSVSVGDKQLPTQGAGVLSQGDEVTLTAGSQGARLILLAAKPLREPVVQYGPFVMNTREQIEQAITDYQNGTLALAA
ncbi:pirin family protein [Stenotrophobium rhamnosiphilum]|uniref:Quercetin 2,3-dioxygenase n=1 Tax=Stenotrophobium rhamnosiphilum TaxID=2029166 RepID=A0A2T5MGM2_9GAMM|nr:pirin family protein [Stenotrophobium rhamnosiphilum]PTU31738.1 quercetin 2,3-dioxygenase [Stenotrophobium rhamnosiphilum]